MTQSADFAPPPIDFPDFMPGSVWLVGAGPGDPGLLTLHAWHALRHADTIVYDALVDDRILACIGAQAVLEFAGKRGGKPSPSQPDISKRLVALARAGRRVLRLKGGDPFVFGRGGEEALALVASGIPFRIVPGITAGIGGLAYAGIPATFRAINHAIAFVTGHTSGGAVPEELDWAALARLPVVVFYMGLTHLADLAQRLLAEGRDGATPLALISRASTPFQRVVETTLAAAAATSERQAIESPVLIVLGEVVRLRAGLDWLGAAAGKVLDPDPLGLDRHPLTQPSPTGGEG
jgi:uroporphyrin-III C-methyltransferase